MGCLDGGRDDPLGIAGTLAVARHVPGLHAIGAMDPRPRRPRPPARASRRELARGGQAPSRATSATCTTAPTTPATGAYYELAERYGCR